MVMMVEVQARMIGGHFYIPDIALKKDLAKEDLNLHTSRYYNLRAHSKITLHFCAWPSV